MKSWCHMLAPFSGWRLTHEQSAFFVLGDTTEIPHDRRLQGDVCELATLCSICLNGMAAATAVNALFRTV